MHVQRCKFKMTEKLVNLFNGLCVLLPFGMSVLLASMYMLGGWDCIFPEHDLAYYSLQPVNHIGIAAVLLFLVICWRGIL